MLTRNAHSSCSPTVWFLRGLSAVILGLLALATPARAQNSLTVDVIPGSGAWGDEVLIVPSPRGAFDFMPWDDAIWRAAVAVSFAGVPAQVTSVRMGEVRARVPNGASRGKVSMMFVTFSRLRIILPAVAESRWEFHVTDPSLVPPVLTSAKGMGNNALSFTWTDANRAKDGFKVYVRDITTSGVSLPWYAVKFPGTIVAGSILTHLAPGVPILPGRKYDLTMTAFTSRGESLFSNYRTATTSTASVTIGASANSPIPAGNPQPKEITGFLDVDKDGRVPSSVITADPPGGLFPRYSAVQGTRLALLRGNEYGKAGATRANIIGYVELPGPRSDHVQYVSIHFRYDSGQRPRALMMSAGDLVRRDGLPGVYMLSPEVQLLRWDYLKGGNGEPDRVLATVRAQQFFAVDEFQASPGGVPPAPYLVNQTIEVQFEIALEPA